MTLNFDDDGKKERNWRVPLKPIELDRVMYIKIMYYGIGTLKTIYAIVSKLFIYFL